VYAETVASEVTVSYARPIEEEWRLLDRVAVLTQAGNEAFAEMRAIYEEEIGLKVPRVIRSYGPAGEPREVTLPI
jgi:hypothetical protein